MPEEKSLQQVIEAAVTAENAGVAVDWKALCFQTYNVAMAEIQKLQELTTPDVPMENGDGAGINS